MTFLRECLSIGVTALTVARVWVGARLIGDQGDRCRCSNCERDLAALREEWLRHEDAELIAAEAQGYLICEDELMAGG